MKSVHFLHIDYDLDNRELAELSIELDPEFETRGGSLKPFDPKTIAVGVQNICSEA